VLVQTSSLDLDNQITSPPPSLIHSFTHQVVHSLIHLFIHSPIGLFVRSFC